KTEDRRRRTEDRGQRTEDRGQRTEDRGQRTAASCDVGGGHAAPSPACGGRLGWGRLFPATGFPP
ncbi:MAG: hypothetical protein JSS03_08965, partial [Proteobacteria bacterium]|nr:hypothetical protein [Pseudomonadota bacterium]